MWTRSLLKKNARQALSGTYWHTFALCLLLAIVGVGDFSTTVTYYFEDGMNRMNTMFRGEVWTGEAPGTDLGQLLAEIPAAVWFIVLAILIGAACIGALWVFFLILPLSVGRNRYFMENRQSPAPLRTVTTIFRTPYLNVVKVEFLANLKVLLGCVLLLVPGIYWGYCYLMVPYLLAENPYMSTARAMQLSHEMMRGEKWHTFLLQLSFFGWAVLGVLTFGIGLLFLEPYYQATMAELYAALRSKAFALNLTDASELGGFVRH